MRAQYLDRMDIERERGITIKSQAVRLPWTSGDDQTQYVLNLIDTPGHVDFTYEVSRSLAACEGAVLLVDAAQGIEAQTLANLYLALGADLKIIPVLNKIDLPAAQPDRYAAELAGIIGVDPSEVLRVSRQDRRGRRAPAARDRPPGPRPARRPGRPGPRAHLRLDLRHLPRRGHLRPGGRRPLSPGASGRLMMSTGAAHETLEVGVISPEPMPSRGPGRRRGRLPDHRGQGRPPGPGRRHRDQRSPPRAASRWPGTDHPKPMVFSGLYPVDGDDYPDLRDALDKLRLNDAALVYEPETSDALGFGFRCGFLGLLHMEIVRERLEREFDLSLISTAPNAVYRVVMDTGQELRVTNPSDFPGGRPSRRKARSRPSTSRWCGPRSSRPAEYIGTIMELCQSRRGALIGMDYLSADRVEIRYTLPLAEIIFDFFDQLKSRTRGYASLDYEPDGEQQADLVKVDILLQGQPVDAFSQIVHADEAREYGLSMTAKLKELIPRQQYEVPIQAAVGARIIARENIRALRKDVLAKCYGGDITRKRKLLERQKEGKKRMKTIGRVDVPQEAFVAALSTQPG